jgi:hypothetical protein
VPWGREQQAAAEDGAVSDASSGSDDDIDDTRLLEVRAGTGVGAKRRQCEHGTRVRMTAAPTTIAKG